MNQTAYDHYIFSLLEPDIVSTGNHKRHKPVKNHITDLVQGPAELYYTGEELAEWQRKDAAKQDEYLKSKGV